MYKGSSQKPQLKVAPLWNRPLIHSPNCLKSSNLFPVVRSITLSSEVFHWNEGRILFTSVWVTGISRERRGKSKIYKTSKEMILFTPAWVTSTWSWASKQIQNLLPSAHFIINITTPATLPPTSPNNALAKKFNIIKGHRTPKCTWAPSPPPLSRFRVKNSPSPTKMDTWNLVQLFILWTPNPIFSLYNKRTNVTYMASKL